MKRILGLLLVGVLTFACGGSAEPEAEAPDAAPVAESMDDEAAIRALGDDYVLHFNMGHGSMVADFYTDEAVLLAANGDVRNGREDIAARLEADIAAASPTVSVETTDVRVMGDGAAAVGNYQIDAAPEGADPTSTTGHWMGFYQKADGAWKISALVTNYDAADESRGVVDNDDPPPPDLADGMLSSLADYYSTHFNMGHASMVADTFADGAVAGFADAPLAHGREAITAEMEESIAMGSPQLTIHPVEEVDLGDGWVGSGGWYQNDLTIDGGSAIQIGSYLLLAALGDDGEYKIHYLVGNGHISAE